MARPPEQLARSLAELRALQGRGQEDLSFRILLLTSSLGSGHLMAADAVAAALREACDAIEIETVDFWSLIDPEVAAAVRRAYFDILIGEPELYDTVYRLDQQSWRGLFDAGLSLPEPLETFIDHVCARIARADDTASEPATGERHPSDRLLMQQMCTSLVRRRRQRPALQAMVRATLFGWMWARLSRRLEQRVIAFAPDAAVATQMAPAALLASILRRRGLGLPLIAVATDFGIHDFWLRRGIGCFCVAHEAVTRNGLPAGSEIHVTGIPLMPAFRHPPERGEARAEFGLAPERPVVLVAGGGLGLGVVELSGRILDEVPDALVAAVSGRNGAAEAELQALASRHPGRLIDCGWTDRMPAWLRAADVVVGKPGGLTVAESLACGRYLLAVRGPGGQEGFNVRFLAEHGAGELVRDERLGERLRALLADPVQLGILETRAAALGRRDGAVRIAALALDAARAAHAPAEAEVRA